MFFNPSDRFVKRGASREDALNSDLLKRGNIPLGDDAAHHHEDVIQFLLFHLLYQFFADGQVGPGHDGEANHIHGLLEGRIDDLVDALMEACVDDFHPCVPKRLGNDLRSAIMAIEARLRNQYTNLLLHRSLPIPLTPSLSPVGRGEG